MNVPKAFVILVVGGLLLLFGLPLLAPAPPPRISTPVPANEATRVSVVATTGIPEKPSDVWIPISVSIFTDAAAIEGGTLAIANIPVEAVLKAKIPPEWVFGADVELGQVTKGVLGDGYIVPGFVASDGTGKINLEIVEDPANRRVIIRPTNPMVILHAYIDLKSLRWTKSENSTLAFSVDDTTLIQFIGDQLQNQIDHDACFATAKNNKGQSGTAIELGKPNVEGIIKGILFANYNTIEASLQQTNPDVHIIRPEIVFEWPEAPCYVLPRVRPDAPGGARP